MRIHITKAMILGAALGFLATGPSLAQGIAVLSYNKPGNFNHANAIATWKTLSTAMAQQKGFTVTHDDEGTELTLAGLRKYKVVILNNNVSLGNAMTPAQQIAFAQWMQEGGGSVGIHGALDHRDRWDWFSNSLAKTRFASHSSWGANEQAKVQVDPESAKPEYADLVKLLPKEPWVWRDEWYSFTVNPRANVDVLITVNETTFNPNPPMGGDHPVTWAMKLPVGANGKQGRFFYTARGHETLSFADQPTKDMLYEGIRWAAAPSGPVSTVPGPSRGRLAMTAHVSGEGLSIGIGGPGSHEVTLSTLEGRVVAKARGKGDRIHVFPGLAPSRVYVIRAKAGREAVTRRIAI